MQDADDRSKKGNADRPQFAGGEGHELSYFARKRGNTKNQAERLIKRVGNDRAKPNAAAEKRKK